MSYQSLPVQIAFDKGRPFFDMVSAYVTAVVGLESVWHPENPMGFKQGEVVTLEGKAHPELRIESLLVHQQFIAGHVSDVHVANSLVCMLMNTAYESVKDRNDRSPEFEFFRHIRNASSHRNSFNFFPNEPSKPAAWRGKVFDHARRGISNPFYGQACFGNVVASADALVLLWDIEQRL